jgi:hypothetical protein
MGDGRLEMGDFNYDVRYRIVATKREGVKYYPLFSFD